MRKINEILDKILQINNISLENNDREEGNPWEKILTQVFKNSENIAKQTKIKEIKNATLVIEVDHPGWLQLLKANEKEILVLTQKYFLNENIKAMDFLIVRC
jgi:hypothetical protein